MTGTEARRLSRRRAKSFIALLTATAALAGGERVLAPTPASALIADETCENTSECGEGTTGGGSSDNDPFEGWQTDQGSDDQDPSAIRQTDQGSDENDPFKGWQTDSWGDPNGPYRGFLHNGDCYTGLLTRGDLIALDELKSTDDPAQCNGDLFDGWRVDNGADPSGHGSRPQPRVKSKVPRGKARSRKSGQPRR